MLSCCTIIKNKFIMLTLNFRFWVFTNIPISLFSGHRYPWCIDIILIKELLDLLVPNRLPFALDYNCSWLFLVDDLISPVIWFPYWRLFKFSSLVTSCHLIIIDHLLWLIKTLLLGILSLSSLSRNSTSMGSILSSKYFWFFNWVLNLILLRNNKISWEMNLYVFCYSFINKFDKEVLCLSIVSQIITWSIYSSNFYTKSIQSSQTQFAH